MKAREIHGGVGANRRSPIHYKKGLGRYKHPKIAIIKLEEIASESLADGTKTQRTSKDPAEPASADSN